jgi:ribosomal protein S15P/S13E
MPEKNEEKMTETSKKTKKVSKEEFEKRILELAEKGLTSEKIGETLRREGVHPKEFEKKISKILGNKYINPDEKNIQEKLGKLEKHLEKNKKDKRAMRDRVRVSAKLKRLKEYLSK